jgi:hypothetical protein
MSLHLSKDAEQDIADIYVYFFEQFGETKVESYYQASSNPGSNAGVLKQG